MGGGGGRGGWRWKFVGDKVGGIFILNCAGTKVPGEQLVEHLCGPAGREGQLARWLEELQEYDM